MNIFKNHLVICRVLIIYCSTILSAQRPSCWSPKTFPVFQKTTTYAVSWKDEARNQSLTLTWTPIAHPSKAGQVTSVIQEDTYIFNISTAKLLEWSKDREDQGAFVQTVTAEREKLGQSWIRYFHNKKKLRELDGLYLGFEGRRINQKTLDAFLTQVATIHASIDKKK